MNNYKGKILIIFGAICLIAIVVFLGRYVIVKQSASKSNPFELNLDSIGSIPEQNIGYRLIKQIKLNHENLHGIAIDNDGNIWVCGDSVILKTNICGTELLLKITSNKITCISSDRKGGFYVGMENHIGIVDSAGNIIKEFEPFDKNSYITSIVVLENSIVAADGENEFLYEYDFTGKFVFKYGSSDTNDVKRRFIVPSYYFDVAMGIDGSLWTANPGRHMLINFNSDGSVKSSWGKFSGFLDGFCGCCNPSHFVILPNGSFITSEKGLVRVKEYSHEGSFTCAVAGPSAFEKDSKGLDLAVDRLSRVYILEPFSSSIHIFEKKKNK